MLEGLEISEILFSELYLPLRIDAETYRPHFMEIEESVISKPHTTLGQISKVLKKGIFDIKSSTYQDSGIPFVRISNLKNMGISTNDIVFIPENENDKNLNTYLQKGDLILSKTAYPAASIVQIENCNTSQDTVAIKLKKNCGIDSGYLVPFLNSKYGFYQMQRWFTGNIQMHLNLKDSKGIFIYKPNQVFQKTISKVFWNSFSKREEYQKKYTQAEQLLLQELNLTDFQPSQEPVNVKNFSDSFGISGRLDAEYYQVKYDSIEKAFDKFERIRLANLVEYPISSGITPKAGGSDYTESNEDGFPFIRAVDLQSGEVNTSNFNFIKPHIHEGVLKRTKLKTNDVLFSIAGTVGRCALFSHEFEANINQAVSILRFSETKVKRLYLVTFFNSSIGKVFISKFSRQGLQTNLNLNEVGDLNIPVISFTKQQEITDLVEKSFKLKKQSEHLLEVAKTGVELAIEQDEEKAIQYINQNVN